MSGCDDSGEIEWGAIRSLYLMGDYAACRRILEHSSDPRAQIWLARIDGREGRDGEALQRLLPLKTSDENLAAQRDIWAASSYGATGDFRMAHQLLDRGLQTLRAPDEAYYRAHHIRALSHFFAREYDDAWKAMSVLLESPHPNDRAQAFAFRSWIVAKRDLDIRAQLQDLMLSLDVYESTDEVDQFTFVRTLSGISLLCREIPTDGVIDRVRRNAARVRVNSATVFPYFQMIRCLGWVDALHGDEVAALRQWHEAEACAPTDFWRIFCEVDRAYLAAVMGRTAAARRLLSSADTKASKLEWSATQDEERLILLTIAQLFAPYDPARAQRYLATFRSLTTQADPRMAFIDDPRTIALQAHPHGSALLELGDRDDAIPMLEKAWKIFVDFEYGWRAALCALKLYEATHEAVWLERAREQAAPWPKSWIASDVQRAR